MAGYEIGACRVSPVGCWEEEAVLEGLDINRFLRHCVQRCWRVSEGPGRSGEGVAVLKKKAL